jgi:pyrroline-5-carboxylate reductase
MKILVIGAGNMGLTYSEGMVSSLLLNRRKLMIYDVSHEVRESLHADERFKIYENLKDCVTIADIIFLAVKPYHTKELFT